MAEKTIKTQETDPNPDLPDGPTQYDNSLKISQLTTLQDPASSDYAVLARPNGDTFKVALSTLRADLSAYKVKEVIKGTYIDNITETADGNGIWKINAEYQGSTSGNYVESLNNASGDLTLSSSDGSILIDNRLRDLEDNLIEPPEYGSTIDLTLNTTTSTMFRAWIEVTASNKDGGSFDFGDTKINTDNSIVTINGVVLEGSQYSLTSGVVTINNLTEMSLVVGDEIGVVSYTAEVPNSTFGNPTYGLRTSDISIVGEDPAGEPEPKAIAANNLQSQQDVNWYLLRAIENIDVPEGIEVPEGLATAEYVDKQDADTLATAQQDDLHILSSANGYCDKEIQKLDIPSIDGLATVSYVDGADQAVQRFATAADDAVKQWVGRQDYLVDEGQNTQIETLENKVDALEGTVVEAKFKADTRDIPSIGGFVLQDDNDFKTMYFSQAKKLEFWKTDFTNKNINWSKILNGDIIRLVMSPDNYANYTVNSVEIKEQMVQLSVTFGSHGKDQISFEGMVYDFTHTTPFDVGAACTKQYSDDQDAVTLSAAKEYADSLDIPDAVVTDGFLTTEGDQNINPQWRIRDPDKSYTYITVAPEGGMGLYHLKDPEAAHHAVSKGWVTSQKYVSYDEDSPLINKTITWNSGSNNTTPKIAFSNADEMHPENHERMLLSGNYRSSSGSLAGWDFGFNQKSQYWNYDWRFKTNLTMRWLMGDAEKTVMEVDKSGVDMSTAYIVGDYSLDGVAEDKVEAVKAKAREIDIGHRLRELKKILVNLKTALKTKSADAQQALIDVLENVEDI